MVGFLFNNHVLWLNGISFLCFSDLGAQIDGFVAVVAHTFVIGASKVAHNSLVKV